MKKVISCGNGGEGLGIGGIILLVRDLRLGGIICFDKGMEDIRMEVYDPCYRNHAQVTVNVIPIPIPILNPPLKTHKTHTAYITSHHINHIILTLICMNIDISFIPNRIHALPTIPAPTPKVQTHQIPPSVPWGPIFLPIPILIHRINSVLERW